MYAYHHMWCIRVTCTYMYTYPVYSTGPAGIYVQCICAPGGRLQSAYCSSSDRLHTHSPRTRDGQVSEAYTL